MTSSMSWSFFSQENILDSKHTRRSSAQTSVDMEQCFFCGKPAKASESLHHASTFGLDARVRQCALQLQDQSLLAKLSVGDLIALEAKYHVQCLVSLFNRARQTKGSHEQEDSGTINQGIALAELVAYIEDAHADNEVVPIFKLADLSRMYSTRLEQLGTCRVNSCNQPERQDPCILPRLAGSQRRSRYLSCLQQRCWTGNKKSLQA